MGSPPAFFQDTVSYLEVASLRLWSLDFLAGPRAFTVPLFFKLVPTDELRIYGQLAVSMICWVGLAGTVARLLTRPRVRPWAYAAILVFSLAAQIVRWDSALLSESLSLSLMAAVTAAWLWFVERPSRVTVTALLLISVLWAFTRDTNAYLVALGIPALAVALVIAERKRPLAIALVGVCAIVAASILSVNEGATASERSPVLAGGPSRGFARSAAAYALPAQQYLLLGDGRWEFPLLDVIGVRILPHPDRVAYFARHGMPVTPALLRLRGKIASGNGGAFYRAPELAAFRRWLVDHGQSTYLRYLLSHPGYVAGGVVDHVPILLFPRERISSFGVWVAHPRRVCSALPGPVQYLVFSHSLVGGLLWLLLGIAAVALAVRRLPRLVWLVPMALIVSTVPHAILVWHGDGLEAERHSVSLAVMARLGVLLMLVFVLDARPRSSAPGTSERPS